MTKLAYTQVDMDAVADNPELTNADFARMRPFADAFPELAIKLRRARGRQKAPTKISTTIRLSPDVIDYFKTSGQGWQSRIDDALKEWLVARR